MTEDMVQLKLGSVLAERYEIVKRLGGGGMGNVYLAQDKRLADAHRAVKEMIGQFTDEASRTKAIDDFKRESQLLASLEHPSIPTIYDYFVVEGRYYLVMKYINGSDLEQQLEKASDGFLPEKTVTEWAIQLCDVFDYIHNLEPPIIYRDMKPANVMLDLKANRIMLVDFGIARLVAPTQKNVTAIGTMGYAPPELFAGKVGPTSDIYSLGATMFHLLTGADPQTNPLLMFDFSRYPRPKQINPKLTDEIDKILAKSVEHRPADRYQTAAEMKKALEEHRFRLEHQEQQAEASLIITHSGTSRLGSFTINKDLVSIGRMDTNRGIYPDIDLVPYDASGKVSRRHAEIKRVGKEFYFEDLGSANGSFLNGSQLPPRQPQMLKSGDELVLGETMLKFSIARH